MDGIVTAETRSITARVRGLGERSGLKAAAFGACLERDGIAEAGAEFRCQRFIAHPGLEILRREPGASEPMGGVLDAEEAKLAAERVFNRLDVVSIQLMA